MHPAVRDDRIWFQSNPLAVVRFRRAVAGEFEAVTAHGGEAPIFRPSFCRAEAPTHWVAVLDLMRLFDTGDLKAGEPTARLRIKVPSLRSNDRKRRAEQELKKAVAAELLASLEADSGTIAA